MSRIKRWFGKRKYKNSQTQFEGITRRNRRQQLIIGLDFGTAFTKVVIGDIRQAYAVSFDEFSDSGNPYLLPGVMTINAKGQFCLGYGGAAENEGKEKEISNIKMRLLDGDNSDECICEAMAFIALVLQYTRSWLMNHHASVYNKSYLDWYVNVGSPTENYHDPVFVEQYKRLMQLAWIASVSSDIIDLKLIQALLDGSYQSSDWENKSVGNIKDRIIPDDYFAVFPEFVAQITGYVRSPSRQHDLHMLIDVGAGTVDICVFNVHHNDKEDVDRFPIFAKSVQPRGVFYLSKHRIVMSGYRGRWNPNAQEKMPSDGQFAKKIKIDMDALNKIDSQFMKEIREDIVGQLRLAKTNRYPLSRKWEVGVPTFLTGGGANVAAYANLVSKMEKAGRPYKIVLQPLIIPDRLEAKLRTSDQYDRLSVAYGLSYDAFDIGEVVASDQVEDVHATEKSSQRDLCPRCRGTGGPRGNDCTTCGGSGMVNG